MFLMSIKLSHMKVNGTSSKNVLITNCLKLGDNFTMNAKKGNKKGVDFYVVLCTHPMHVFEEDYTCHWGYQFQVDDVVVIGTYY